MALDAPSLSQLTFLSAGIPDFTGDWLQAALGLILITDLSLLASERQRMCIRLIAVQGVLLGLLPLFAHQGEVGPHLMLTAGVFLAVKGMLLPWLLRRTYKKLPPQPPIKPYVDHAVCVFAGLCGFVFSLWLQGRMGLVANPLFVMVFPTALATIFAGLLMIVTRKKALTQLFGYLVMENGIYLLGVPMAQGDSLWLEMSILLDILVGVFVMGVAIHHINRAFDSTNVDQFASLRD